MTKPANGASSAVLDYARRVVALKQAQGEYIRVDDVAALVASLLPGAGDKLPALDELLHDEVLELRDYIQNACREIVEIGPQNISKTHIPNAADELGAVVEATREAAEKIMDAADEMQGVAEELDAELAARISDIATKIYEASSFQDITGQRIAKVVGTLQHIEEKISRLAALFGDTSVADADKMAVDEEGVALDAKDLLNGPQMAAEASSQDEIDALLASFD
jgi:chemotaxis protein CheZ